MSSVYTKILIFELYVDQLAQVEGHAAEKSEQKLAQVTRGISMVSPYARF